MARTKIDRVLASAQTPAEEVDDLGWARTLVTIVWVVATGYLLYQIALAEPSADPEPLFDIFSKADESGRRNSGRIAIFYVFGAVLLGPLLAIGIYTIAKFAVNTVKEVLLKIFPVPWVSVILPSILLLVLVPGYIKKQDIKWFAMSAYVQVQEMTGVAGGYNPIADEKEKKNNDGEKKPGQP